MYDRNKLAQFLKLIESEFPSDRLTWQKGIATFHPESAAESARLFKLANREHAQLYITGFGNNIDPLGEPFESMVVVRTDRLNKLIEVAPEDYFVTVGSGYPLRELNLDLASSKLFLPVSMFPYVGSIGGAIAVNVSGFMRKLTIPIRKYLIRAEIVTPTGDIITPGSICFKSVAGYDIVKFFAPSWGLLGFVVSASFRVLPTTALDEYTDLRMNAIERDKFFEVFDERDTKTDAVYARKAKLKFDPNTVLPILPGLIPAKRHSEKVA